MKYNKCLIYKKKPYEHLEKLEEIQIINDLIMNKIDYEIWGRDLDKKWKDRKRFCRHNFIKFKNKEICTNCTMLIIRGKYGFYNLNEIERYKNV